MKDKQLLHICLDYCTRHEKVRTELDKGDFKDLRAIEELSPSNVSKEKFSNIRQLLLNGSDADLRKIEVEGLSFYTVWNNRDKPGKRDPELIIKTLLDIIKKEKKDIDNLMYVIYRLYRKSLITESEYSDYINILESKNRDSYDTLDLKNKYHLNNYQLYYNSCERKIQKIV